MAFESEQKVVKMHNMYAGNVGFSIRKSHTKRRADKSLVCSNEGLRDSEFTKNITGTDCNARVQFSVGTDGIWTMQKDRTLSQLLPC